MYSKKLTISLGYITVRNVRTVEGEIRTLFSTYRVLVRTHTHYAYIQVGMVKIFSLFLLKLHFEIEYIYYFNGYTYNFIIVYQYTIIYQG